MRAITLLGLMSFLSACHPEATSACDTGGGQGAPSTCLKPQQTGSYYVTQSNLYFDTLDTSASANPEPDYSSLVARWEWPPWLELTGYTSQIMIQTDQVLLDGTPSTIPTRDCEGFTTEPFGRCHVSFEFWGGPCPIYEEFTFNDAGQMTFIEAWSDLPGLRPQAADDYWAEAPDVSRLSTKIPGLGNSQGLIDLTSPWMQAEARQDPDVATFVQSAENFWTAWTDALTAAGPTLYPRGCGWPDAGAP